MGEGGSYLDYSRQVKRRLLRG